MRSFEVLVVGGGAAGLSAALVLTRARRSVVVVDAGQPRNAPAAHLQGFLTRDGLPPGELLALGRQEVASYGGTLMTGNVTEIRRTAGGFEAVLADGEVLSTRRVLITTGLRDELPDVEGVRERWGRDLLHCPYCHGYEVRDQPLGVLGGGPAVAEHALLLRQWSSDVVLFTHGTALPEETLRQLAARDIDVVEGAVARLVVDADRLSGVQLVDGRFVRRTAVFVRPDLVPHADLLTALGCETGDDGWVVSDAHGRTTEAGVWVAGNAANPRAQLITAAGEGSAAAISLNADLVAEDVRSAVLALEEKDRT